MSKEPPKKILLLLFPPLSLSSHSGDHFLAEDQMRDSHQRMAAPWCYERIERAGHWLPLEQPDRVAELALQWFAQH